MPNRDRLQLTVFGRTLTKHLKANYSATASSLEFAEMKGAPPSASFSAFSDKGAICKVPPESRYAKDKTEDGNI